MSKKKQPRVTKKYLLERVKHLEEVVKDFSDRFNNEVYQDIRPGYYNDEVTLRGYVEAILAHLNIDVDIKDKACTPAHVVVKKNKPAKKGKK